MDLLKHFQEIERKLDDKKDGIPVKINDATRVYALTPERAVKAVDKYKKLLSHEMAKLYGVEIVVPDLPDLPIPILGSVDTADDSEFPDKDEQEEETGEEDDNGIQ